MYTNNGCVEYVIDTNDIDDYQKHKFKSRIDQIFTFGPKKVIADTNFIYNGLNKVFQVTFSHSDNNMIEKDKIQELEEYIRAHMICIFASKICKNIFEFVFYEKIYEKYNEKEDKKIRKYLRNIYTENSNTIFLRKNNIGYTYFVFCKKLKTINSNIYSSTFNSQEKLAIITHYNFDLNNLHEHQKKIDCFYNKLHKKINFYNEFCSMKNSFLLEYSAHNNIYTTMKNINQKRIFLVVHAYLGNKNKTKHSKNYYNILHIGYYDKFNAYKFDNKGLYTRNYLKSKQKCTYNFISGILYLENKGSVIYKIKYIESLIFFYDFILSRQISNDKNLNNTEIIKNGAHKFVLKLILNHFFIWCVIKIKYGHSFYDVNISFINSLILQVVASEIKTCERKCIFDHDTIKSNLLRAKKTNHRKLYFNRINKSLINGKIQNLPCKIILRNKRTGKNIKNDALKLINTNNTNSMKNNVIFCYKKQKMLRNLNNYTQKKCVNLNNIYTKNSHSNNTLAKLKTINTNYIFIENIIKKSIDFSSSTDSNSYNDEYENRKFKFIYFNQKNNDFYTEKLNNYKKIILFIANYISKKYVKNNICEKNHQHILEFIKSPTHLKIYLSIILCRIYNAKILESKYIYNYIIFRINQNILQYILLSINKYYKKEYVRKIKYQISHIKKIISILSKFFSNYQLNQLKNNDLTKIKIERSHLDIKRWIKYTIMPNKIWLNKKNSIIIFFLIQIRINYFYMHNILENVPFLSSYRFFNDTIVVIAKNSKLESKSGEIHLKKCSEIINLCIFFLINSFQIIDQLNNIILNHINTIIIANFLEKKKICCYFIAKAHFLIIEKLIHCRYAISGYFNSRQKVFFSNTNDHTKMYIRRNLHYFIINTTVIIINTIFRYFSNHIFISKGKKSWNFNGYFQDKIKIRLNYKINIGDSEEYMFISKSIFFTLLHIFKNMKGLKVIQQHLKIEEPTTYECLDSSIISFEKIETRKHQNNKLNIKKEYFYLINNKNSHSFVFLINDESELQDKIYSYTVKKNEISEKTKKCYSQINDCNEKYDNSGIFINMNIDDTSIFFYVSLNIIFKHFFKEFKGKESLNYNQKFINFILKLKNKTKKLPDKLKNIISSHNFDTTNFSNPSKHYNLKAKNYNRGHSISILNFLLNMLNVIYKGLYNILIDYMTNLFIRSDNRNAKKYTGFCIEDYFVIKIYGETTFYCEIISKQNSFKNESVTCRNFSEKRNQKNRKESQFCTSIFNSHIQYKKKLKHDKKDEDKHNVSEEECIGAQINLVESSSKKANKNNLNLKPRLEGIVELQKFSIICLKCIFKKYHQNNQTNNYHIKETIEFINKSLGSQDPVNKKHTDEFEDIDKFLCFNKFKPEQWDLTEKNYNYKKNDCYEKNSYLQNTISENEIYIEIAKKIQNFLLKPNFFTLLALIKTRCCECYNKGIFTRENNTLTKSFSFHKLGSNESNLNIVPNYHRVFSSNIRNYKSLKNKIFKKNLCEFNSISISIGFPNNMPPIEEINEKEQENFLLFGKKRIENLNHKKLINSQKTSSNNSEEADLGNQFIKLSKKGENTKPENKKLYKNTSDKKINCETVVPEYFSISKNYKNIQECRLCNFKRRMFFLSLANIKCENKNSYILKQKRIPNDEVIILKKFNLHHGVNHIQEFDESCNINTNITNCTFDNTENENSYDKLKYFYSTLQPMIFGKNDKKLDKIEKEMMHKSDIKNSKSNSFIDENVWLSNTDFFIKIILLCYNLNNQSENNALANVAMKNNFDKNTMKQIKNNVDNDLCILFVSHICSQKTLKKHLNHDFVNNQTFLNSVENTDSTKNYCSLPLEYMNIFCNCISHDKIEKFIILNPNFGDFFVLRKDVKNINASKKTLKSTPIFSNLRASRFIDSANSVFLKEDLYHLKNNGINKFNLDENTFSKLGFAYNNSRVIEKDTQLLSLYKENNLKEILCYSNDKNTVKIFENNVPAGFSTLSNSKKSIFFQNKNNSIDYSAKLKILKAQKYKCRCLQCNFIKDYNYIKNISISDSDYSSINKYKNFGNYLKNSCVHNITFKKNYIDKSENDSLSNMENEKNLNISKYSLCKCAKIRKNMIKPMNKSSSIFNMLDKDHNFAEELLLKNKECLHFDNVSKKIPSFMNDLELQKNTGDTYISDMKTIVQPKIYSDYANSFKDCKMKNLYKNIKARKENVNDLFIHNDFVNKFPIFNKYKSNYNIKNSLCNNIETSFTINKSPNLISVSNLQSFSSPIVPSTPPCYFSDDDCGLNFGNSTKSSKIIKYIQEKSKNDVDCISKMVVPNPKNNQKKLNCIQEVMNNLLINANLLNSIERNSNTSANDISHEEISVNRIEQRPNICENLTVKKIKSTYSGTESFKNSVDVLLQAALWNDLYNPKKQEHFAESKIELDSQNNVFEHYSKNIKTNSHQKYFTDTYSQNTKNFKNNFNLHNIERKNNLDIDMKKRIVFDQEASSGKLESTKIFHSECEKNSSNEKKTDKAENKYSLNADDLYLLDQYLNDISMAFLYCDKKSKENVSDKEKSSTSYIKRDHENNNAFFDDRKHINRHNLSQSFNKSRLNYMSQAQNIYEDPKINTKNQAAQSKIRDLYKKKILRSWKILEKSSLITKVNPTKV
ncbi:hypothetical protein EDEG_01834 [Edhazardia aedis USNM 41457]|uniref:Uncharacterized protein n=1 Tax=Edhazardia aedis (strain USNM 41457) TaxID=1003232 RepID=J9D7V5_EDHAE|nr:hypothetical protein EDEG_01834 [Edhazardia aedis USNM 41457]|eukprot:EJW03881.1 hypothetical protein EDEG_01834 [Edhazardia aedis USNM 41457]